jgi:hypothetical protein
VRSGSARADALCVALIAAFAILLTWPATLGGKVLLPADLYLRFQPWRAHAAEFPGFRRPSNPMLDPVQQFYPWRKFAAESIRQGEIPLWNPYSLCGTPFVGNNQSAIFYPETWLFYAMPPERAFGYATALYFFLAGSFMFAFLRTIGLARAPAMFGAAAFMCNGFAVGWLCFPTFRSVGAWLPAMLLAFERAARARTVPRTALWTALCALAIGVQFLAGNLQVSFYVVLGFAAYVVAKAVVDGVGAHRVGAHRVGATILSRERGGLPASDAPRGAGVSPASRQPSAVPLPYPPAAGPREGCPALAGRGGAVRPLLIAATAALIGFMLAAGQLLPTLELAGRSSRTGSYTYEAIKAYALAPQYLLNALMPDIWGNPMDYNHWGAQFGEQYRAYTETAWYAGAGTLLLAAIALVAVRRRQVWFWAGVWVIGVLLAFGTPLSAVCYYLVPGFKQLPGIGRAVLMSATAASVLAAFGLQAVLAATDRRRMANLAAVVGIAAAVAGLIAGVAVWMSTGGLEQVMPGIGDYTLMQMGRFLAFAVITAVLIGLARYRPGLVSGLLVAVVALDMFIFVMRFTPFVDHKYLEVKLAAVERMKQDPDPSRMVSLGPDALNRMPPNTPMLFGLQDIQCSDSLEIGRSRKAVNSLCKDQDGFAQPDVSLPALDMLNVRYLLTPLTVNDSKWQLLPGYETGLYKNTHCLSRIYRPRAVIDARKQSPDSVLQQVAAPDFDPRQVALIGPADGWRAQPPDIGVHGEQPDSAPTVRRYGPNRIEVSDTINDGQFIVVADGMFPGWRAFAHHEIPIWTVNGFLRGVVPGDCEGFQMLYLPGSYTVGVFLACLAAALIAGMLAWGWKR